MPGPRPAEAVRNQQQRDAQRLLERIEQVVVADRTVNYTLQKSSFVLPGVLVRFLTLAALFRLNSAKKWRLAVDEESLPEPLRRWLGLQGLADLVEQATADWIPPRVFADILSWLIEECRRFCRSTGRSRFSQADQDALIGALAESDWKVLGNSGRGLPIG